MQPTKKRVIEGEESNQATRIIYEYIVTDPPFQELRDFCERFNNAKKENTPIIDQIQLKVAKVQSLIEEMKPQQKIIKKRQKRTSKRKVEPPLIGQPLSPELALMEIEWQKYYAQLSLLFIKILQERKFFCQLLNFIKLSVAGDKYVIRLTQITTVIDCAEIVISVGKKGHYEIEGVIEQMNLNELILQIILSLKTIQDEDENFEDLFYSLQKQQSKENLKKIFAIVSKQISKVDAQTIVLLNSLFVEFQDKQQYITLASMQKTREATLAKCRKEIIFNLLSILSQKKEHLFPEILLNLKPKQKQAFKIFFKGLTVAFSPVLLTILQNKKEIKEATDLMYLSVLNSDTINYSMIELYYQWLERQNLQKLDLKQLNIVIQKLLDDLIDNFDQVGNKLRLIFLDSNFMEFYRVMNENYLLLLRNDATGGEAHFVKAVQTFNILKDKAELYVLKPIKIPQRRYRNIEFKYKNVNYQYKTDYIAASHQLIKFLFQDLNELKIPQIDIIEFISFQNDKFAFNKAIPPTEFQYFFCQFHIQYYLENLYGLNIVLSEEQNGRINILHYPIANYNLDLKYDDEEIIFQALSLISKHLNKQDFSTRKQNYFNLLTKQNELSANTQKEKNIVIKSLIQKIIMMVQ